MHDEVTSVPARVQRMLRERILPARYSHHTPVRIAAWAVPGEPVPFAEAVMQRFEPFDIGTAWGTPWSTTWFRVAGTVPAELMTAGKPLHLLVDLGFTDAYPGFQAEALAWRPNGTTIKAVEPRNRHVPIEPDEAGHFCLYLEAAANPDVSGGYTFAPTPLGDKSTAPDQPLYRLRQLDMAVAETEVDELHQDVTVLLGLAEQLSPKTPRRAEILLALQRALDVLDLDDIAGSAAAARNVLAPVLNAPAYASAHRVIATGHAHIDSAWLWPTRETIRKCARTFSNVLDLMDSYPEMVFSCSSAQQYAWIKAAYPELYARIRECVAEGRFIPVGGMWVESDTNMPGGEALARQFIAGKQFFLEEFGVEPLEVWLPDSFGYSAAMPQIARAAGQKWFLTQKISWNDTNTMPHHTFWWEGIDGTRIYTHFPPADTYNGMITPEELAKAERQFADKGRANTSLLPFGYGNGGGGPTREMVLAARRQANLEGSPRVTIDTPRHFFESAQAEYPDPPTWVGEMYLELHRGTYTSQARTKQGNRRSEHALRQAELWASHAAIATGLPYPYERLERCWHTVLLQQFHDILPGSAIAWVHREAEAAYATVLAELNDIIDTSVRALVGEGDRGLTANPGPLAADGIAAMAIAGRAKDAGRSKLTYPTTAVTSAAGAFIMTNDLLAVRVEADGTISSLRDLDAERELIPAGTRAGVLQLHRDTPTLWDAWDVDRADTEPATANDLNRPDRVEAVDGGVRIIHHTAESTIVETLTLAAGERRVDVALDIDWHERQKLLKFAIPLDLHCEHAASEIQFGHIQRPIHTNTSWDHARFETCQHRWVHVGEPGYGVAVANDATYGSDISRRYLPAVDDLPGRGYTQLRMSVLRSPLFPDPQSDQGRHERRYSIRVGAAIADAVADGYRLNLPPHPVMGDHPVSPLVTCDNPAIIVEAVKLAEDRSGDLVLRLYEAHGTAATGSVRVDTPFSSVYETDLLERRVDAEALTAVDHNARTVHLRLRPFQIVTLRFARA